MAEGKVEPTKKSVSAPKKVQEPAPKKVEEKVTKSFSDKVKVKNVSKYPVCVSTGTIESGKTGECTLAEARNYHKVLEEA